MVFGSVTSVLTLSFIFAGLSSAELGDAPTGKLLLEVAKIDPPQVREIQGKPMASPGLVRQMPRFSENVYKHIKEEIANDLSYLAGIRLCRSTPLLQKHLGDNKIDGNKILEYFNQRVNLITLDEKEMRGIAYSDSNGVITLTLLYFLEKDPIHRLSILLHESHHAGDPSVGGRAIHAICPRTPLLKAEAGKPSCDRSLDGAYGLQIAFLQSVANYCQNCDENTRLSAAYEFSNLTLRILVNNIWDVLTPILDSCDVKDVKLTRR